VKAVRVRGATPITLILFTGGWLATAGNLALWQTLYVAAADSPDLVFVLAGTLLLVTSATVVFLGVFAWGVMTKPVLVGCVLVAGVVEHFMVTYGVVVNSSMLANAVQTDYAEVRDLMSLRFLTNVAAVSLVPIVLILGVPVIEQPLRQRAQQQTILILVSALLCAVTVAVLYGRLAPLVRNDMRLRHMVNPITAIGSVGWIAGKQLFSRSGDIVQISTGAKLGSSYEAQPVPPPLLVLVIGETARADHFSMNGYARDTTPALRALDIINFTNVRSCGTDTRDSLPCKFSALGRDAFVSRTKEYENLLDVLQAAGLAVLWIDNQSGCKNVCDRIPRMSTSELSEAKRASLCQGGECQDRALLDALELGLQRLPAERRAKGTVVVLHQMGSHGPAYYRRSPPDLKRFLPECKDTSLANCDRESLVNAYDNSIVATDDFLARTIGWLASQQGLASSMLYISDHGESLGEFGLYLHGLPYAIAPDSQKHVPFIAWFSEPSRRRAGLDTACLKGMSNMPLSHDNFSHVVLGLLDIDTPVYRRPLDAFGACRTR
jgi:lipid A ethanolaminephosphotransferase